MQAFNSNQQLLAEPDHLGEEVGGGCDEASVGFVVLFNSYYRGYIAYDTVNRILFGKWNDNKVVSYISLLGVSGRVTVKRRVGS